MMGLWGKESLSLIHIYELYKIVEFVCSNGKNIICVEEEYLDQIEKICKRVIDKGQDNYPSIHSDNLPVLLIFVQSYVMQILFLFRHTDSS